MTIRQCKWATLLGVLLGLSATAARAQDDVIWRAVPAATPPSAATAPLAPVAVSASSVILGRPEPLGGSPASAGIAPVDFRDPIDAPPAPPVVRAQAPDPAPPAPPPPPPPPPTTGDFNSGVAVDRPLGHSWWDQCKGWFNKMSDNTSATNRCLFQSDHCFDYFASPVTNPFYFEDPRALTEVRPIFIYQSAPSGNPIFRGGNSEFFGTQARVAVTERLSFVINELGFVSLNPNNPSGDFTKSTGFAQFSLGPKYTFLRNPDTGSVLAGGLTFITPAGSGRVFQNTGNLGLDPYLSYAQRFGQLPQGFGSFNFMSTFGYQFGVDSQRSEFLHGSLHLDYNIANLNKFYPLLELNWFHYTRGGHREDVGFEGADLANFGSHSVGSRDYVTLAAGMRYKFNEAIQTGIGLAWPVTKQKEISDFTVTLDLIFRY